MCLHQVGILLIEFIDVLFHFKCGFRILVVVPFRVYYVISLLPKHVLIVINSDSITIRSQNVRCY